MKKTLKETGFSSFIRHFVALTSAINHPMSAEFLARKVVARRDPLSAFASGLK
jgi:hypothetical protein